MEELEHLLTKYEFKKRVTPLKEGIIDSLRFQLPQDYRFYLENYEPFAEFIKVNFVRLWPGEELAEANDGYEFPEYRPGILGIGTNGGGEFIGIQFRKDGTHRIILSDFLNDNKEYFIEIGTSFFDMLVRLDNGREWFE
ncbi:SMI1/KNR4 family protein SUKH-1 [Mucilaginibacter oryzae]|uniref:SMI1/KNR4 family protein SUKH-1 n=1 Tax=Mucilaginibacter oryzae TaxID=468058 RepID=A0A316HG44_9SPHI|nr:SMI1/KNR4 family protein [Mucilaginibacter oryzae]PWK80194.1 SMI1/KNR4 family protein SUKH-1 [Mucilaginibacter oryzae]